MGSRKRPKLTTHYAGPRAGSRDLVSIDGRCRVGEGDKERIGVLDLDPRGCRVSGIGVAVTKADVVTLWIGPVGPITARLRWMKRGLAGGIRREVRPEERLTEEQVQAAASAGETSPSEGANVIALRRRTAG